MSMYKALHLSVGIDTIYQEGRRGFASAKDCMDTTIQIVEYYIKMGKNRLI